MTKYEPIDPMLSQWAVENGVQWYTEYQDTEVRTFGLNVNQRDRVMVSVDVPEGDQTTIRIGQNQRGLSRLNRIEIIPSPVSEVSTALDRALQIAKNWAIR